MGFGKVFIATSIDGFIAREDGSLDWLPAPLEGEDYGYAALMDSVDGIIMGRATYETVLGFGEWPFTKPVVVLSRTLHGNDVPAALQQHVQISNLAPSELVASLQAKGWQHAYIDGGQTIRSFLQAGEVSEITLTHIPILLGAGRPLFGALPHDVALHCVYANRYPNHVTSTRYNVVAHE